MKRKLFWILLVLSGLMVILLSRYIGTNFTDNTNPDTNQAYQIDIRLTFPNLLFDRLVHLAFSHDNTNRMFAVSQKGKIYVFENRSDVDSYTIFLDITEKVRSKGNEEGLLNLVFDPHYSANDRFYVYYSASNPRRSILSMYLTDVNNPDKANPKSEIVILEISQPYSNHNGGSLVFGPDGYLYIGLGDGGSGGDPLGNGQNTNTLLGSILRIDLSKISKMNPYSIPEDNPFIGIEEINIIVSGRNYGWNTMEGFHCYKPKNDCIQFDLELPVYEYETGKEGNCSVVGGFVYRGSKLPQLTKSYIFGDYCSGKLWTLKYDIEGKSKVDLIIDSTINISSFGEGDDGELYILGLKGNIYNFALNKIDNR